MKKYKYFFTVFKDSEQLMQMMNAEYGNLGYRIASVVVNERNMLDVILYK